MVDGTGPAVKPEGTSVIVAWLTDIEAERQICAVAIDSPAGARLAVDHGVTLDCFHHPIFRRLFAEAMASETRYPDRLGEIAAHARVGRSWVETRVRRPAPPTMFDTAGCIASRVIDVADRRRQAVTKLLELAELGVHGLDQLVDGYAA